MKLQIQKLDKEAKLPSYAYKGDAGMDIYSIEEIDLAPGEKAAVRTGLRLAIPEGYAGFVWDKSGLAAKHHIKTMAGVVDSNYRGELQIVLTNLGKENYHIEKGSKIAQLIISSVASFEIEETEIADETERGEGGFGSSGTQ
ncbi:dUTP diphosphatase [Patescibacteria group bacterium]|nr:dUTP diphosphatase [Patescibacteria group bacterium]